MSAAWDVNEALWKVCMAFGDALSGRVTHDDQPVKGAAVLWAIAGAESTWGRDRLYARREPAYAPGGRYYRNHVPDLHKRWGALVPCSYGSFQVLYVSCWELGFRGHPIELQADETCAAWAVRYIERRALDRGAKTLTHLLDAYNSGTHADANVPHRYIEKASRYYRGVAGA